MSQFLYFSLPLSEANFARAGNFCELLLTGGLLFQNDFFVRRVIVFVYNSLIV